MNPQPSATPKSSARDFSKKARHAVTFIYLLWIVAVNFFVYAPSFFRPFEDGDHLVYLAELRNARTLSDALSHYNYPVTRHFEKGDEILFRPLLFAWLGLQYHFFSYHYVYWNLASFMLHLAVVFLLFKFFLEFQPRGIAFLVALLFSIFRYTIKLVFFTHVNGYILSFVCLMLALLLTRKLEDSEKRGYHKWAIGWMAVVIAGSLFYEPILPFSWCMLFYLYYQRRRKGQQVPWSLALPLLIPTMIYILLYVPHHVGARISYVDGTKNLFARGNLLRYPWNVLYEIQFAVRACLAPLYREVAALIPVLIIFKGISTRSVGRNLPMLTLLVSLMVVYLGIIVFGRNGAMPGYYFYLLFLLTVMIAALVIDVSAWRGIKKTYVMVILIGMVGHMVFQSGRKTYKEFFQSLESHQYFALLVRFVDRHKTEPGFSFNIDRPFSIHDAPIVFSEGYPDEPNRRRHERHQSELLFSRYYDPQNPKYRLRWEGNSFIIQSEIGQFFFPEKGG